MRREWLGLFYSVGCRSKPISHDLLWKLRLVGGADVKEDSYKALIKMTEERISAMPVVRNNKLVGIFDTDAISKFLRLRIETD